MRVLVTGAAGFVGRPLCQTLAAGGFKVIQAIRRIADDQDRSACRLLDLNGKIDYADIDAVVHLAARVHVMEEPEIDALAEFRKINVEGTLNLAAQAAAAGVKRFIYISSIKVNGEFSAPGRPFTAADAPAPADAYGISKYEAEQGLRALAERTGLEVVIIRPPLVYGPAVKANFLRLMRCLDKGIPLPLAGVRNRRSLLALGNLTDLIRICLTHPEAAGRIFLAADGDDLSTAELLTRLGRALGKPARLFYLPKMLVRAAAALTGKNAAFVRLYGNLQIDDRETRAVLAWKPPLTADEGLRAAAGHFLKNKDVPGA